MSDFGSLSRIIPYIFSLLYLGIGAIWAFVLIYILGWVRGMKGERDPLLGGKVIYNMVFTIGFQVFLVGAAMLGPAIVKGKSYGQPLAQPLALMVSGAIIGFFGMVMINLLYGREVNDSPNRLYGRGVEYSQVFRQSMGLNAVINGLLACVALVLWFMMLFQNGFDLKGQIDVIWLLFVYFIGHIFCARPVIRMIQAENPTPAPESVPAPAPEPAEKSEAEGESESG